MLRRFSRCNPRGRSIAEQGRIGVEIMENVRCNLCGKDSTEFVFEVEEQITGNHSKFRLAKEEVSLIRSMFPFAVKESVRFQETGILPGKYLPRQT